MAEEVFSCPKRPHAPRSRVVLTAVAVVMFAVIVVIALLVGGGGGAGVNPVGGY
ncbi:MAG TPA: hypothetical protein VE547_07060 [Mycobacteriales bacterium]|nr:hypothetical protein [Mycobacteriales bacterium]